MHDRETGLVQEISKMKRAERSRKRKREEEARLREEEKRKKSKTETDGTPELDGVSIKSFALEECCAIYADAEFANEMGVLNKAIKVKLDLASLRSESIRMVFPLRCWVNAEEMPLTPDEVRKYGSMDISDDESGKEEEDEEMNSGSGKMVIESCITYNICRVYRSKKAKSKYEIGTLYAGNTVEYSKNECGGGWFKVLSPLPGWIQYSELTPPELTTQELEKLEKQKKAKEKAIDLTAETTAVSKDVSPDAGAKGGEKDEKADKKTEKKGEKSDKKLNGTKTEKEEGVAVNGTTNGKTNADKKKKEKVVTAAKAKEDKAEIEIIEIEIESEEDEECSDDDWNEFEDPDEETLSGNWSCGQKGGCFTLKHKEGGILDGFLENKETCSIDGKVDGENVNFNQKWQKGSVHGIGVVTVVKE